jgi:hypothetical protein
MYLEFSAIENTHVVRKKSRFFHIEKNGLPKIAIVSHDIVNSGEAPMLGRGVHSIVRHEECLIPMYHIDG